VRRRRLLIVLTAVTTVLSGAFVFGGPGASADTATPEIAYEGWYDRFKDEDVQADPRTNNTTTVCDDIVSRTTTLGCGPVSPGDSPAPRSKATGAYVVANAGGEAGDRSDSQGDTAWAAFQWDLYSYEGATVEKFVFKVHLAMDNCTDATRTRCMNNGDTYQGAAGQTAPPIQACNVLDGWSSDPGANLWAARPKASDSCVVPTNEKGERTTSGREFRFDLTQFAQTWVEGKGYGIVIRPGTPAITKNIEPFQMTFSGYYDPGTPSFGCNTTTTTDTRVNAQCTVTPRAPEPVVTFAYTPAVEEDLFGGGDDFGGGDEFFEEISTTGDDSVLEAVPDIDVIPTDAGSDPLPEEVSVAASGESSLETAAPRRTGTRRISAETSFPWAVLLLLPLVALAFWGTGTALGPIGDPVPARQGGVSRVLAQRQAAHRGSDFYARNRS
jgi:hypothetical protein